MKKNILARFLKYSSVVAMGLTFLNINTMCSCIGHQPKVPQSAMRLKKQ